MASASLAYNFVFTRGQAHRYGPHRSQEAELHVPRGRGPHPVVVLIHGGAWRARYGKRVMRGLAADLVRRGRAVWNIEYRRVGDGGGWPETFEDVAAAIDHLAGLSAPLDLERVTLVGHSAGGHLALWAASRTRLPEGAPGAISGQPAVTPRRAVSMAGVCDLAGAFRAWRGGAVLGLMATAPDRDPGRYALADPRALAPAPMPVLLVHGADDETVPVRLSRDYAATAQAAGGKIELIELVGHEGRHRAHIHPSGEAWRTVVHWLSQGTGAEAVGRSDTQPHAAAGGASGS